MELYMGNTTWANGGAGTGRTLQQTRSEITAAGVNVVRFPVVPQTLNANDPQGRDPFLKNHASVKVANSRLALENFVRLAAQNNIEVILDVHSCSNYVGWRKGRLDARPPYVDKDRENYDFKRESFSCSATNNPPTVTTIHAYNQTLWLNDLKTLAGLGQQLGVSNIIGIDIFNEPWDYTRAARRPPSRRCRTETRPPTRTGARTCSRPATIRPTCRRIGSCSRRTPTARRCSCRSSSWIRRRRSAPGSRVTLRATRAAMS